MIKIIQIMKKNQHVFYVSFSLIFLIFLLQIRNKFNLFSQ